MAAGRKGLVGRRRNAGDEGEDEEDGPVMVDDSQSEGSVLSDVENEEDDYDEREEPRKGEVEAETRAGAENDAQRDAGDNNGGERASGGTAAGIVNGHSATDKTLEPSKSEKKSGKVKDTVSNAAVNAPAESAAETPAFQTVADTAAMMNGLSLNNGVEAQDAVDFESMGNGPAAARATRQPAPANGASVSYGERQRREHEEYRRKRDSDPAFIPNRGNFFMHDTRGQFQGQAQPPTRGAWQGRGRGRGVPAIGGPFSPAGQVASAERSAKQPWKHDLHDTINEEPNSAFAKTDSPQQRDQDDLARPLPKAMAPPSQHAPRVLTFSSTTTVGKAQIRVLLPGMKAPVTFSEVPWKKYTRLPNHRPPLRRDKPVRVSLPEHIQRYIFPSPDRSFIFIPRQLRPNQQGYNRGSYQRSVGGYGYSSRRTSMYGGSVYTSSVAASRRSSMAGVSRADAFSPNPFAGGNRPVVRLPHGQQHFSTATTPTGPLSGHHTPVGMPQLHTYPLPQQPTYQGTPTSTMHQPRPQKAISVTGIESPALLAQASQGPDTQPFQNQLPAHMGDPAIAYAQLPAYRSPQQPYQYAQPPPAGTPLSNIPEQAIHAAAYQPQGMSYAQPSYYQPYPPQQGYYYSPPGASGYPSMPMYGPAQAYNMPTSASMSMQQDGQGLQPLGDNQSQPQHDDANASTQSGMVAHESNGMVFYLPASEAQQQEQTQNYQPAEGFVPSYAMPGLPPPTPAPEASSTAYYYTSAPLAPMRSVQPMFYPGAGQ